MEKWKSGKVKVKVEMEKWKSGKWKSGKVEKWKTLNLPGGVMSVSKPPGTDLNLRHRKC